MKILFDTQIFDWQINGGISRYFAEVLQRLDKNIETEVLFKIKHSYNTYIQNSTWLVNKPVLKNLHFKGKLGALKIINQRINRPYVRQSLKKREPDIFHPTYYDPYFQKYLNGTPLVLTVYDLTNEKFDDKTDLTAKILSWKKKLILAADHIISISENTKKDIIEYYKVKPEKITTIYLSGGFDKTKTLTRDLKELKTIPPRYILFVGSRNSYKNFKPFLQEVSAVMIKENVSLVVAGGGAMNAEESEMMKKLGIVEKVIAFSHVSDTILAQLYRNALVFVFPSLYEGFGLPVLEAMQCNCPALLSNNSSLPEVGGTAAAYFDPYTENSLQTKLTELINNKIERQRMIDAGKEQIEKFDWNITTSKHIDVYNKIVTMK